MDILAIEVESFMEPMGTEEPTYLQGKQAGLKLAAALIREWETRARPPQKVTHWAGPILQEDVDDYYGGVAPEGRPVI